MLPPYLKPGSAQDLIEGSLHRLDLASEPRPPYECMSYVWGEQEATTPAIIHGSPVVIKSNLDDALRRVRSRTQTKSVWVDAICINQVDLEECANQVALMTRIYRRCSRVNIWLGRPKEGSLTGNPFAFLEHFASGKHYYDLPGCSCDPATGLWTWTSNPECRALLDDFLQVVTSPWWTRAWTAQECFLPDSNVLNFGDWTITWDIMLLAEERRKHHSDGPGRCCKGAVGILSLPQLAAIDEWMWIPSQGRKFMDIVQGDPPAARPPFDETILAFSGRECLNPRDKIYSLLSLATHPAYRSFQPNYKKEVAEVYIDIFKRMVRENKGRLNCFMGTGFGSSLPGLPSWVRDFSQTNPLRVNSVEQRRIWWASLYQASHSTPLQPHCDKHNKLHYRGTYADTICTVGLRFSPPDVIVHDVFAQWLDLCQTTLELHDPHALRSIFARIICGDVCKTIGEQVPFRRARTADFPDGESWQRLMSEGDLAAVDIGTYGWGVRFGSMGRCLFTTAAGRVGLCPSNARAGDEVWVLAGAQVPFVVRPIEAVGAESAGKHSFLGDCFLDGVMDGELSEQETVAERPIVMA